MLDIKEFPNFIRGLPEIELPISGVRGWLIQGSHHQVIFVEFDENIEFPEHTHDEQWEFPLVGRVILHIQGNSEEYHPGDNFYIPANIPHSATVFAGYKAIIIFNSPDRYSTKL
jgi:quercetin dioxygenase-like cupin family protein